MRPATIKFKEGDKVVVNVISDMIIISKKNSTIFDNFESFLPKNFNNVMKKLRSNGKNRLEKLGV